MIIKICAKCSDCFSATLSDGRETVGTYVPNFLCPDSDYVEFSIDLDTGKIVGWKKPTERQLNEYFGKSE